MQNDLNEKRFCQPFASVDTKTGSRNAFHMPLHIKLATGEGPSMVHRVGKRIVITELWAELWQNSLYNNTLMVDFPLC